jgi:hypothetical protein
MTPLIRRVAEVLTAELIEIDYALRIKREDLEILTERRRKVTELLKQYEELAPLDAN